MGIVDHMKHLSKNEGIPLKERQELELLEQVLKKALKIRSSSAVSLNYQENPCSSGSVDKAPAVKGHDKINSQKHLLLSSELKGSHQHEGQLKSTAGCGNVATRQVPFPNEWSSVQIAAMEEELDVLTQLGLDLTHCYNAELQRHQLGCSPELSPEKEYLSLLMLTGLEKMMVQIIKEADRLKKDWERKMAWWYGALCPLHSRVKWHSSERPCIPPLLAYSSKGELEELQSLRLYVSQLKLEIHAHQAMCDTLINQISCESPSSNRPSATALRGVYSLLGEGGAQFPSLVLDNDSAQM
ncbi:hypothetical protein C0J50_21073 [Silurus asotus]|uniref:Uncharacterized protein n=1 Tax=Silurus asotus TaxID=30991 RepID=A0AAD5AP92_SILAS|nr:hypothetical protein C0J50_21073 [Silurus asotus]